MSNTNKGTSAGVFLTNPDNSYSPYTASNPQPAGIGGFTDIADNSTFKRALIDSDGHLKVDIVSGGGGGGGDATAANQTTMISHLSDIDTAVTGTLAVSAASLPLPSGAATSANQTTGKSSLATIAGCENGASALQVDIQADAVGLATGAKQDNIQTQLKSDFHTNNVMNAQAIANGATATTSVHDFGQDKIPRDFTGVLIQITDSAAGGGQLQIEGSFDNSTYHNLGFSTSFSGSGLFALQEFLSYVALPRYIRFVVQNTGFGSSNFSVDVGYYRS